MIEIKKRDILVVALVVTVVLSVWLSYYFSDKKVIKRKLTEVAQNLNREEDETAMQIALKMRDIQDLLATSCRVIVVERDLNDLVERDMIIRYLMYHRNLYDLINVSFEEMLIDIPTEGMAIVQATVRVLKVADPSAPVEELAQVELNMEKREKEWLLHQIILPETLLE
jgi:hypothetical protein